MRHGLPPHPSSVGRARRLIREHLKGTALEGLADTAELVVSEVVTNAIVHTGTRIELSTMLDGTGLRVEVSDSGKHLPVMASYDTLASTGRGLHLVAELSDHWGVESKPGGKVFWFHLGLDGRDESPPSSEMPGTGHAPSVEHEGRLARDNDVIVVLLNLPALMHGAWQQHAKSLLRDLLLLGIDVEAIDEIESHAAAMDALAILEEQIGTMDAGEDPAEILVMGAEPHVTQARVSLVVPVGSVAHFETLDSQLDSALSHAQAGRLLTPPTQPEFAAFRRWLCEQVRSQADGERPEPWAPPEGLATATAPWATAWDHAAVSESPRALVGADNAGLITTVSVSAVRLLKYEEPEDLVGTRLVDIIPTRYHQAHLAGFTLHQINGRGPLLGLPVVVPVRCRDNSEVEVEMTILASSTPEGASIFIADLVAEIGDPPIATSAFTPRGEKARKPSTGAQARG